MPVTLTCFCCGHSERHADVDTAFNLGWARAEHMWNLYTACPPCVWLEGGDDGSGIETIVEQHRDTHRHEQEQKTLSVTCGVCDNNVLDVRLLIREQPDPRDRHGSGVLHVNTGIVVRLTPEQLVLAKEALAVGDIFTVLEVATHVMPYCKECALSYCSDHWHDVHEIFDDGFYDYTEATCPRGHTHEIDD